MLQLLSGHESDERLSLLINLTGLSSELYIKMLKRHFVTGIAMEMLYAVYDDASETNFDRCKGVLNDAALKVERIKELDSSDRSNSDERVSLVISMTSLRSPAMIGLIKLFLMFSIGDPKMLPLNGMKVSNFNKAFKPVKVVMSIIEQIKEIDYESV